MVLNTCFNENEPVVCLPRPKPCAQAGRPDEALDCFLRTKMDLLVLGSSFIARS
jgi:carbamoyltransferase